MDFACRHCGALFWEDERCNKQIVTKENYQFSACCSKGNVALDRLDEPPALLRQLFEGDTAEDKHFRKNILYYNNALTFTSCRYSTDERVDRLTGGIKPFSIRGELYHLTGPLTLLSQQIPSFAQTYFYDPEFSTDALLGDSRRSEVIHRTLLLRLRQMLEECRNPFIDVYKTAKECIDSAPDDTRDIILNPQLKLFLQDGFNKSRTNVPTSNEVAMIIPDEIDRPCCRDIVLAKRSPGYNGNPFFRIDKTHPAYMPLHYVLFFPTGKPGWSFSLRRVDADERRYKKVSQRAYARYQLFKREGVFNPVLEGTRLGQQYVVDNWAIIDQIAIDYMRFNQKRLRSDLYQGVVDALANDADLSEIGVKIILPSSHTGSPRFMQKRYQNSMAIVRHFGKPTLFITFTANPNWPELQEQLGGRSAQDRPDIVARVFELKRARLMELLKTCFGTRLGEVWTLEFQVRGLPHVHILLFLNRDIDFKEAETIDQYMRAELLTDEEDPDGTINEIVKSNMVHGPCGHINPEAPCMKVDEKTGQKTCSKGFPKPFCDSTFVNEDNFAQYRRRDNRKFTKRVNGRDVELDNSWIVPYSPFLLKTFDAHINVEVCASVHSVKYIHKYIYKGQDRVTVDLHQENDELHKYLISRYIGPQQAAWRIMEFPIHGESPSVYLLAVHLPGKHAFTFNDDDDPAVVQEKLENNKSNLMAFFEYNRDNDDGRGFLYVEFPEHYVFVAASKNGPAHWKRRSKDFAIGRIALLSPAAGERYYLRLLLTSVRGPTGFEDLRTVNGRLCPTFKQACIERGLLENDDEWNSCFEDAKLYNSGKQLRSLFVYALTSEAIADPITMWNRFSEDFCDDLRHRDDLKAHVERLGEEWAEFADPYLDYGLYLIKLGLEDFEKTPQAVGLVDPVLPWDQMEGDRAILAELEYDCDQEQADATANIATLNQGQRAAFDTIVAKVDTDPSGAHFFLDGPAGTGKSHLYKTLCNHYRGQRDIVLCVASSGIASLVLPGGTTAHSRFKIPIDIHEDNVCSVPKQGALRRLIQRTKLIIWDEVPMQHKYNVEAVHRTFCDYMDNEDQPFGGVPFIFGGDFAQTVPVITKGSRAQQCGASLRYSFLWPSLTVLHLTQNMRVREGVDNKAFADWIGKISYDPRLRGKIELPAEISSRFYDRDADGKVDDANGLYKLCEHIYPADQLAQAHEHPEFFRDRAILTLRNDTAEEINTHIQKSIPNEEQVFFSANKSDDNTTEHHHLDESYLQTIKTSALPNHELRLKVGSPIMLMRNLYAREGLCNGVRLTITSMSRYIIEARIMGGAMDGQRRLIPRIRTTVDVGSFKITRTQFPIRLCYAITVNKSQGQTLSTVGLDLRSNCFAHGQLYVALSRVTDVSRLSVLLKSEKDHLTENVIWPEVLLRTFREMEQG